MTQEEKAKAYDEAIEKARSLHDNYDAISTLIDIKEELEHIFPELRESKDEKTRKEIVGYLKKNLRYEWATWLEKQGKKPAWTEEDRAMAFTLMRDIDQVSFISREGKNERIGWLNSLDEKFASTESAWSEEDECYMAECINAIATKDGWSFEEKRKTKHWLKSLKDRYTWKPSEKQIEALEDEVRNNKTVFRKKVLNELLEQLKKL